MANSNKKNVSGAKNAAPKRSAAPRQTKKQQQELEAQRIADEQEKRENIVRITGVVVFAVSLLLFFIAVISGEGVWSFVHGVYIGLFGWLSAIVLSLLALAYSVFRFKNIERNMTFEIVSIFLLVMLLSSFVHIVTCGGGDTFGDAVKYSYLDATTSFNGGAIGGIIGWLLLTMGKAPAIIVTLVLMLVDVLLLSRVTVNQFFSNTTKPVRKMVEHTAPIIEERRERRRTGNIDIYLDEEPPVPTDSADTKPRRTRKAADTATDNVDDDDISRMINEINESTRRNRQTRQSGAADQPKTIDQIVRDASEDKPDNKQDKPTDPVEEFTVTDEEMNATVKEYKIPPVNILVPAKHKSARDVSNELKSNAELLVSTLASFGVAAEITDISRGPTVTRYELKPASGVRISKITNLADDIALNLAATNVRIEAPIPGKAAVGIEIPNGLKNTVSMRELVDTPDFKAQKSMLSAGLGKDIAGNTVYCDLAKMPHLLIAGTTGSGKSVCMNSIIVSILYRAKPDEVKLLMIDPKKVEFSKYEGIPHLLVPVVTDPRKASGALGWAVSEMLKRYQMFSDTGVRDIEGYNKFVAKHTDMEPMPKVVICIDELADLMMAAPKEVEDSICRLAQMARAAGMHLVIATQRPSVDVITGLIKANISSRIALTVSSQIDSRTILDTGGAEKLLGRGDMLYAPIGASKPQRVQGCFISDEEVEALCEYIKKQGDSQYSDEIQKEIESKAAQEKGSSPFGDDDEGGEALDPLFDKAVDVVLENGRASTSFLQRKLSVGYSRGSKIMDQLEERRIIGPQDGAKPREILINQQQWLQMQAQGPAPEFTADNTDQMSFGDDEQLPDYIIDNQDDGAPF